MGALRQLKLDKDLNVTSLDISFWENAMSLLSFTEFIYD